MTNNNELLSLNIHHLNERTTLTVAGSTTLYQLCNEHLKNLPTISSSSDPSTHRLIFKLVLNPPLRTLISPGDSDQKTLHSLGLNPSINGTHTHHKILLITTQISELEKAQKISQLVAKREAAKQEWMKNPIVLRDTSRDNVNSASQEYRFHQVSILQEHLPHSSRRLELLKLLSTHPSIQKQMVDFKFTVLHLGELNPITDPHILGLNVNSGQSIRLRLLTDDLLSVRPFSMVRRVLAHELAHNRIHPHDNRFKELNSKIYKGMIEYDARSKASTHRLGGPLGTYYEPEEEGHEIDDHCQAALGAISSSSSPTLGISNLSDSNPSSDPRTAAASAALKRAHQSKNK